LTVFFPLHSHRRHFYRDTAFALEIHFIQYLLLHAARFDGPGLLEHAIGERGFAVIDMRE
jgi:hypothetical protein